MKFSTVFTVALVSVAELASAIPTPAAEEEGVFVAGAGHYQDLHKRQVNPVTGNRKGYSGQYRVYRQELNHFVTDQNGMVLNLFLLALERMQSGPRSSAVSYWDISGIHGRPYQGWNGEAATGNSGTGYCTHGSTLFPTWHRPYLALYEQTIWNNAQAVVNSVTNSALKAQFNAALLVMRIPYWDWAINNAQMPSVMTSSGWPVIRPDGSRSTMRNPLYAAYFQSGTYNDQSQFPSYPFYQWSNTLRYPTSNDPNAQSQMGAVNQQLAANAASLRQRVYQILTSNQYKAWSVFSNKGASVNGADSIEAIHDVIHGLTGNGGHMSYVDYSSFDPIFWFHHANIDRLFAIWQAINPHNYVTGQVNGGGTYGVPPGTYEDVNTPLTPFRGLNGQFWTSSSVRDTSTFGYGYVETPKWRFQNKETQYAAWVRTQVNNLYGSTTRQLASASKRRRRDDATGGNSTAEGIDNSVNQARQYFDWKVDITADKAALGGSYFVHVFLGHPSSNPAEWSSQKELVGDYVVFTSLMLAAPGIDPATINTMVSGTVPLTQALIDQFEDTELESLDPADVGPFLLKHLHWRVSLMNDTSFAVDQVAGLDLQVLAAPVTLPASPSDFPEYGNYTVIGDITQRIGKNGGHS